MTQAACGSDILQYTYTQTGETASEENNWHRTVYAYDELGQVITAEKITLASPTAPLYTITLDPDGGNILSGVKGLTVEAGSKVTLPTPKHPFFIFKGWYLDGIEVKQKIRSDVERLYKKQYNALGRNPDIHLSADGRIQIVSTNIPGKSFITDLYRSVYSVVFLVREVR